MAMFDDPNKELEQLQKKLLEDEAWFEKELDSAKAMLGEKVPQKKKAAPKAAPAVSGDTKVLPRNPGEGKSAPKAAPKAPAKSAPKSAPEKKVEPKVRNFANGYAEPEQEQPQKTKGIRNLVILAAAETAGIVGLVAYWLLVLLK